ncbi:MAG TPA: hypothetical protein VG122_01805, partial [Gemmata sp.]|nr:hypothetical protein [Gemmata sp.]
PLRGDLSHKGGGRREEAAGGGSAKTPFATPSIGVAARQPSLSLRGIAFPSLALLHFRLVNDCPSLTLPAR